MPCRAPRTVLDFFKPKGPGDKAADGPLTAKRKSSDALHEIHVNRGCTGGKQQKQAGEHLFNVAHAAQHTWVKGCSAIRSEEEPLCFTLSNDGS